MRITESRLRKIIRQVIKENDMADFEKTRDADPKRQNEELFNDLSQFKRHALNKEEKDK